MRYSSLLPPALALALASSTYADMQPLTQDTSDVISLTADDFDTIVNPEPLILVEFFAPWCGHCKALAPEYEEAATALKAKNIKISKVDCVDQTDLCQSKGISGYPTLHVYKNGTPTDYTGPRKADGIVAYMVKQSLPAVSLVSNSNFEEFSNADKVVVVAYAAKEDPLTAIFATAAEAHRDEYLFGQVEDQAFATEQDITTPTIVVYRSFDDRAVPYPYPISAATPEEIAAWVQELSVPILDEVSGENYATYASSTKPLAYLFLDPTAEGKEEKIAAFKPIAAKYKSKLNFVWIDAIKFGDHGKALNLNEPKWPSFVIQDLVSQLKYPMDQTKDHTEEATEEWIKQYLDGKLVPSLKSQPIPETQDEPVFTVVGKQFDEVVLDDSKDVFVEFYATWCGHCKRLKPIWDSLGEHFANVKDRVVIAKMEATENDLPPSVDFRISGFPTLKFKPAGSKEWLDYDGDRTLESLVAFVEEKAKNSLEVKVTEPEVVAETGETQEPVNTTSGHDEL